MEKKISTIVRFQVHYRALYWEKVVLCGNVEELGNWHATKAIHLTWNEGDLWVAEVSFVKPIEFFEYKYAIKQGETIVLHEFGANRQFQLSPTTVFKKVDIHDEWQSSVNPAYSFYHTSFFEDIIFRRPNDNHTAVIEKCPKGKANVRVVLKGRVKSYLQVFVTGNTEELGNWSVDKAVRCYFNGVHFEGDFLASVGKTMEYKFFLRGNKPDSPSWESGSNRKLEIKRNDEGSLIVVSSQFQAAPNQEWRGYGLAIPIFSLRTKSGMGIGEFNDLKEFIDFNASIGSSIIQILPINDTRCSNSWVDSYPYSALSVFALHPIYLNITSMTKNDQILKIHSIAKAELNSLTQIDYERVMETKETLTRLIYEDFHKGGELEKNKEFKTFCKENMHWLLPYACFLYLRQFCGTNDWTQWPTQYKNPNKSMMRDLEKEHTNEFSYTYFVQFFLHKQLSEVVEYAKTKGVGLKGDLPIGVNPSSTDCWLNPHLFNLDMSTGAPPDQFSEDGQNWGFPTYNWDEMAKDNYSWWKRRLQQMAKYFQSFRIDHILGFFRIWEIPTKYVSGLMGHFSPSIPIHKDELTWKGIWDMNRLCEPYITEDFIRTSFGNFFAPEVVETYFKKIGYGHYALQDEFDTEKKIYKYMEQLNTTDPFLENTKKILKSTLLTAIKNVVLLRDAHNENNFYPRINMEKTTSFQALEWYQQEILKKLYVDYYYHRQEGLWNHIGMTRLPIIKSTSKMLVCGEDLGMIPACVPPVMKNLSIVGLCVQRMPADSKKLFQHPNDYPYMTVCTPSSHDCSTIRAWWEENREITIKFWHFIGEQGDPPMYAEDWICRKIFEQHMHSRSMLAIFPIQELFSMFNDLRVEKPQSEQINEPSNPKHYWRYRMHVNIEDLAQHEDLRILTTSVARESGRI